MVASHPIQLLAGVLNGASVDLCMALPMASDTEWSHFEPVLSVVALVVIVLGFNSTSFALMSADVWEFAFSNGFVDSANGSRLLSISPALRLACAQR